MIEIGLDGMAKIAFEISLEWDEMDEMARVPLRLESRYLTTYIIITCIGFLLEKPLPFSWIGLKKVLYDVILNRNQCRTYS